LGIQKKIVCSVYTVSQFLEPFKVRSFLDENECPNPKTINQLLSGIVAIGGYFKFESVISL
jgi:hypothetical protein